MKIQKNHEKNKKKSGSKILPQARLDLMTSDFPVLHPTTELSQHVLSAKEILMTMKSCSIDYLV